LIGEAARALTEMMQPIEDLSGVGVI